MKRTDREHWQAVVNTVVANIAFVAVQGADPPAIGIALRAAKRKLTRYDRKGFGGLPAALEKLDRSGILSVRKSYQKGIASQIVGDRLIVSAFRYLRPRPEDFTEVTEGQETIQLSKTERDYVDGTVARELIDYEDTTATRRYREEMARINTFLAEADLVMEPDGGPFVATGVRHLCRYFKLPQDGDPRSPRFDLGGRLFGGWWQELPRARRHAIRIDGEPIADLDFSSMFLRLAYLAAGKEPPKGDLYAAAQELDDPRWRDGVKKTTAAMLFRASPLVKLPREIKDELPPGMTGKGIRAAILAAHPALEGIFETGIGLSLMFTESQILVTALLKLIDRNIPALPMHDGLMVACSKVDTAMEAMSTASEEVTGMTLPIILKQ